MLSSSFRYHQVKKTMNKIFPFIALFFLTFNSSAQVIEDYNYPMISGNLSTVAGSYVKVPNDLKFETLKLKRKSPKNNRLAKALKLRFFPAKENKNLKKDTITFIFGGIGSDESAAIANLLAYKISEKGLPTIVVPSIFSKQFAKSFSKTGYVGNIPQDATDLFESLIWVKEEIKEKTKREITKINIVGYSLGALSAAHVEAVAKSNLDKDKSLNKVLLINPPVDLLYGLRLLDQSAEKSVIGINGTTLKLFQTSRAAKKESSKSSLLNLEHFTNIAEHFSQYDHNVLDNLISRSLMSSLAGVIRASQDIFDLGVLPRRPPKRSMAWHYYPGAKSRAINSMNFEDYISRILVPYYRDIEKTDSFSLDEVNRISSLTALDQTLRSSDKTYLIHNADDFLLRGEDDLNYLIDVFQERALIFPRGGHLGNIWHDDMVAAIRKTLLSN